jgi:hypothetical protein
MAAGARLLAAAGMGMECDRSRRRLATRGPGPLLLHAIPY